MVSGPVPTAAAGVDIHRYPARITVYVVMNTIIAASGGALFGYDLGITGGVESMNPFLKKFFPTVYKNTVLQPQNSNSAYCSYDNQGLQAFSSTLFIAGLFASLVATVITRGFGRKLTMTIAGLFFLIGAGINAGAVDIAMLIVGRICLGIGVGFANQVVPLYLSELSPPRLRGAMNIMFQLATTIGIVAANFINYGTQHLTWGWRLSLGLAAVPATVLFLGSMLLPESPESLVQRGYMERARAVLVKVRGTTEVDYELNDIVQACEIAATIPSPWRSLFTRRYRPQLIISIFVPIFQQFTGINAIMFYVPVLFKTLGSGSSSALLNAGIIGAVNVVATFVAIGLVDHFGRKVLYFCGGVQMFLSQIAVGIILGIAFSGKNSANLPKGTAIVVLVVICIYVAGFAYSWGPLGWLTPSEIQPLETRSAGMGMATACNFLATFIIGQTFLSMLCSMQFGIFLFFAGFVLLMTIFAMLCIPETKGVPLEQVEALFAHHWFWRRAVAGKAVVGLAPVAPVNGVHGINGVNGTANKNGVTPSFKNVV